MKCDRRRGVSAGPSAGKIYVTSRQGVENIQANGEKKKEGGSDVGNVSEAGEKYAAAPL